MERLASRMAHIAPFEVMEIQTLARRLESEGRDVIHMEIGEPDFTTPQPIVDAAIRALNAKPMFYTSALGITPLREAISRFYRERYQVEVAPERIIVTAGSSAALLLALGVLLDPGEEVLLADPSYPCNRHFVRALEGVPRLVPVGAGEHYQLTPELAAANWNGKTRIVMVASPSNPTGTLVPRAALEGLHALARARGATLLVDEIYQGLTYEGDRGTALSLGDDVFVINSFSKYFQMTGWRLGWLVAPPAYVREVEKLAQNLFISASTVAQHAALAAFAPETIAIVEERRRELAARRDCLLPALKTLGFRIPVTPEGAFYIYADSSAIARDSDSLARDILQRAWVAMTPGKDFGFNAPERHIRIAYTQPIARLEEAMKRIARHLQGC
jgi:aspartate/methionine/tyrosine aminotransferase